LRERIKQAHAKLSPTAIESYLQCPFKFFAEKTLRLRPEPKLPEYRLDPLVQGSIAHTVLERVYAKSQTVQAAFEDAFREGCAKEGVPDSYRTEAIRLELLHNLERFVSDNRVPRPVKSLYEKDILVPLDTDVQISGRIDRMDIDADGRVAIIDYKYRSETNIKKTVKAHGEGTHVQGGLYMLAIQTEGEYVPGGMVYFGFKRSVGFDGWVLAGIYNQLNLNRSQEEINAVIAQAKEVALQAVSGIREGRIGPKPADTEKCDYCEFANVCRVETTVAAITAGGAGK
jgi:ATP-dependent helicase/DNAse subunit B